MQLVVAGLLQLSRVQAALWLPQQALTSAAAACQAIKQASAPSTDRRIAHAAGLLSDSTTWLAASLQASFGVGMRDCVPLHKGVPPPCTAAVCMPC
jgi:hypothetical protein